MPSTAADWISLAEAADILAASNVRFKASTIGTWARTGKLQSIHSFPTTLFRSRKSVV